MSADMRAMVLDTPRLPLAMRERRVPELAAGEVLLEIAACGVCRTDLHVVDGELPNPKLPIVPGHEIVGRVAALGTAVTGFAVGERIGVPWLGYTCGPAALKAVKKGGRVVCGGIHMSDIPAFPYRLLWEERHIVSVANLTRADATEFLAVAAQAGVRSEVTRYPLADANAALADLREGRLQGAAVLIP